MKTTANQPPNNRRIWYESDPAGTAGTVWQVEYLPFCELTEDHQRLYCGIADDTSDFKYDCPVDARHESGFETSAVAIDLFGNELRPFVPMFDHGFMICTREFEDVSRRSNLTGLAFRPAVTINCDQTYPSVVSKTKGFVVLEFVGDAGLCDRIRLSDFPGNCPFCGYAPMFCSVCGKVNSPCVECDQITIEWEEKAKELGRYRFDPPAGERAVSRQNWDGTDFFSVRGDWGGMFVSRAGKEFLETNAPGYFRFTQARLSE